MHSNDHHGTTELTRLPVNERGILLGRCREPIRRWRRFTDPNPTMRRGHRAASVEREQKDDRNSRQQP
jgi:hypothetical protein